MRESIVVFLLVLYMRLAGWLQPVTKAVRRLRRALRRRSGAYTPCTRCSTWEPLAYACSGCAGTGYAKKETSP